MFLFSLFGAFPTTIYQVFIVGSVVVLLPTRAEKSVLKEGVIHEDRT